MLVKFLIADELEIGDKIIKKVKLTMNIINIKQILLEECKKYFSIY